MCELVVSRCTSLSHNIFQQNKQIRRRVEDAIKLINAQGSLSRQHNEKFNVTKRERTKSISLVIKHLSRCFINQAMTVKAQLVHIYHVRNVFC